MAQNLRKFAVIGSVEGAQDILASYKGKYQSIMIHPPTKEDLRLELKGGAIPQGVEVVVLQSAAAVKYRLRLQDPEIYDYFPSSVKLIIWSANGYDNFNMDLLKKNRIALANTPFAAQNSTADTAMYLTLAALRKFQSREMLLRKGIFKWGDPPAYQLEGKTIGFLGLGGIGRAHAIRAFAHDMKIVYHSRNPVSDDVLGVLKGNIEYIKDRNEMFARSDVVAVHVPLSKNTADMINKEAFSHFKKGSYLINTSRGGLVDEDAFFEALENGTLAGAGIDVFKNEPKIDSRFLNDDRIAILPHTGGDVVEVNINMTRSSIEQVDEFFTTGTTKTVVPELAEFLK